MRVTAHRSASAITLIAMIGGLVYVPATTATTCPPDRGASACCCACELPAEGSVPGVQPEGCCLLDGTAPPATPEEAVLTEALQARAAHLFVLLSTAGWMPPALFTEHGTRSIPDYRDLSPPPTPLYRCNCALLI